MLNEHEQLVAATHDPVRARDLATLEWAEVLKACGLVDPDNTHVALVAMAGALEERL